MNTEPPAPPLPDTPVFFIFNLFKLQFDPSSPSFRLRIGLKNFFSLSVTQIFTDSNSTTIRIRLPLNIVDPFPSVFFSFLLVFSSF